MRYILCFLLNWCIITPTLIGQQSKLLKFSQLSRPEKIWVLYHPFILKKSFEITHQTISITDSLYQLNELDQIANGGKIDAFRHGYWMYSLTKEIGPRKALSLGNAHEKGNVLDYKKGRLEEGFLPDSISIHMDLLNNSIAIEEAQRNQEIHNQLETAQLVINMVKNGSFFIIKMDSLGNCLNSEGNIIPEEEWHGTWRNDRILISSE